MDALLAKKAIADGGVRDRVLPAGVSEPKLAPQASVAWKHTCDEPAENAGARARWILNTLSPDQMGCHG